MTVCKQNTGHFADEILRTIKITRHEEARHTFEINLRHGIFATIDLTVNDRIQRRLRRHRPEAL
jgi:hypothetical protein